jgi:predicted nucleic acid-binding Zn ribbon protein
VASGLRCSPLGQHRRKRMNNIFYIIGVIVVVLIILGYFGLR